MQVGVSVQGGSLSRGFSVRETPRTVTYWAVLPILCVTAIPNLGFGDSAWRGVRRK